MFVEISQVLSRKQALLGLRTFSVLKSLILFGRSWMLLCDTTLPVCKGQAK